MLVSTLLAVMVPRMTVEWVGEPDFHWFTIMQVVVVVSVLLMVLICVLLFVLVVLVVYSSNWEAVTPQCDRCVLYCQTVKQYEAEIKYTSWVQ